MEDLMIFFIFFCVIGAITSGITYAILDYSNKRTIKKQELFIEVMTKYIMHKIEYEREISDHKIVMKRLINEPYVVTFEISIEDVKSVEGNNLCSYDIVRNLTNKIIKEGFLAEWNYNGANYKIFVAI